MADQSHLDILARGVEAWNSWRALNLGILVPDLSGADLSGADLSGANLEEAKLGGANLTKANLTKAELLQANLLRANLSGANFSGANLSGANLYRAGLMEANLSGADLSGADLFGADLRDADLSEANLFHADLRRSALVKTDLTGATLTGCRIYGISAWSLNLEGTKQLNLNVSDENEPALMVDDLEVAQFVYLLLNNEKLRNVIETMTSKAVLILGNFSEERKAVLEEIRNQLRERDYLPILFDFAGPQHQRFIDTVTTVARLSRFVIADITQPKSVIAELTAIVDSLPLLPIQPLILRSEEPPYAFIRDVVVSDSVLKLHRYGSLRDLQASFDEAVVDPALDMRDKLEVKRLKAIEEKLGAR